MAIDVDMVQHTDYLEFVVDGVHETDDAVGKFHLVLDGCRLTGLHKVLIDFRDLQGGDGGTERIIYVFGVGDLYKEYLSSGGPELQIAFLASVVNSYEPGLEVAVQNGWPFRLFDELDEALEWLDIDST